MHAHEAGQLVVNRIVLGSLCLLDKQCCSAGHCPLASSTHVGSWHQELASVAQHFAPTEHFEPANMFDQNDVSDCM